MSHPQPKHLIVPDSFKLSISDRLHLRAAEGWLDLGDWRAANDELEHVTPTKRAFPEVLRLRFRIYCDAKHWELALEVAESLCNLSPTDPNAWIDRSFVLHEMKRTAEAEALLLPALDRFPEEPTIPYDLACYACVLGRLDAARAMLERTFALCEDDAAELKAMALDDPDLADLCRNLPKIA